MTLPTLTVLLDDGSGSFPYNITKYVTFDEGFSFNRGRADWQGGVTASQMPLRLNNSDGRFTPGSTIIASPSPITVDQKIRVRETINGVTTTRFTGYVKSWPVAWSAVVTTIAFSSISAVDAQARAERCPLLPSWIGNEIAAKMGGEERYYPLNEPVGATRASNQFLGLREPLNVNGVGADVVFGTTTAPGTEASPGATFAGGKYLASGLGFLNAFFNAVTVIITFSTSASGTAQSLLSGMDAAGTTPKVYLGIDSTGHLTYDNATNTSVATVNDGAQHVVIVNVTTTSGTWYLDGVSMGAISATTGLTGLKVGVGFTGTIAHVAWDTVAAPLSVGDVSDLSAALLTGFAGERTDQRVARLAGYAGLSMGTVDVGETTVPTVDLSGGQFVWPAIQDVVDAEGGIAFVNASGAVNFYDRARAAGKTTPDLTLAATSYITPDVEPVVDDQDIKNFIEASSSATGITQTVRSTSSERMHGRYSDSPSYLLATDLEVLDRANWIIAKFAEPTTRYGTLSINLFKMEPAIASSIISALDVNVWLRVTMLGSQNPGGTTVDVMVQGFTETVTSSSWTLTCNVVSRSIYTALILDDPVFGALDSYPLFF